MTAVTWNQPGDHPAVEPHHQGRTDSGILRTSYGTVFVSPGDTVVTLADGSYKMIPSGLGSSPVLINPAV